MRGGRGEEKGKKRGEEEAGVRAKVGDQPPLSRCEDLFRRE